ncbi:sensor domain-containing diguanylate cyclase [Pseudoalteromonas luteoviolacea]|uniref:sensor domain-containing diguanylate cyclase n=1 Tax=Pseudoalteromonas luteoviolacea TaxID=43657 RepID=UPI001154964A|nr:sensor domain-containing diguanylate cyclase [Pseudoalteromonas luteoviolacea]TQF67842.1 sensor domain-containing diguanylate cyclase [Pseudoalteromonas luteoviolacea]
MSASPSYESICLPIKFMNALSRSQDLNETLNLISYWLPKIIESDRASVCLGNRPDETLEVYALFGNNAIKAKTILPIHGTMVGRVYQNKTLEIQNNLRKSEDLDCKKLHQGGLNSCMDAPLQKLGNCFGTLNIGSLSDSAYQPEDAVMLECIANWLANYLHSQMEISVQKKRAETDPLTETSNRRCLTTVGNEMFSRWKIKHQPFSMIMIDIDNFKRINDCYGHNAGDQVLINFSSVVRQVIRKSDHFFRMGGEEFVILVEGNDKSISKYAERIRQAVEDMSVQYEQSNIKITISCGVTSVHREDDKLECVYCRADQALYQSKQNGRNLTTVI